MNLHLTYCIMPNKQTSPNKCESSFFAVHWYQAPARPLKRAVVLERQRVSKNAVPRKRG